MFSIIFAPLFVIPHMLKKLDIYIIRKFLGTFFYSIALLSVIVVIFDLSEQIDDILKRNAPLNAIIFDYYLNFIPFFINLFSYLFTFISVIFFTSKLAGRNEIVAVLSSGISFSRLLKPYMISAVFLAAMSFILTNFVIPHTNKTMWEFEKAYLKDPIKSKDMNIHMQLSPGVFAYVESFNASMKIGQRFSLEKFNEKGEMYYKLNSDRITWDSTKSIWRIDNYYIRTIDSLKETLRKGPRLDTLIDMKPEDFTILVDDIKTMNYFELRDFIAREELRGSPAISRYRVEQHQRYSFPLATIVLTMIGVSVSSRKVRGGIGIHLGIGITLTFTFILFMQFSNVFATFGNLPPVLAAWIPIIIYGILGIFLLKWAPK